MVWRIDVDFDEETFASQGLLLRRDGQHGGRLVDALLTRVCFYRRVVSLH
jgi:hypothetical protein